MSNPGPLSLLASSWCTWRATCSRAARHWRRPVARAAITATLLLASAVPATQATAQSTDAQKIWLEALDRPGTGSDNYSQAYSTHEGSRSASFFVRTDLAHWSCANISVSAATGTDAATVGADFEEQDWNYVLVGGSFNSSTTLNVTVADNSEREGPERFRANLNGVSRAYMIRSTNNGDYPLCDAQESTTTSGPLTGALVKHSDPTKAIGVWSSTECENNPSTPGCDELFSEELFECDLPSVPRPCWTEISSVDPIRANPTGVDVWIADNDGAHFTMTGPSSVTEGESATFRVTVSNKTPGTDMLVRWKVEETGNSYSATQNGDFAAQKGTLTFNSNDQTEMFTVTTIDDDDDEHNEEVYISVIGQSNEAPIPIYGGDEHGIRNSHRPKLRIMDNDDPVMRIRTVQDTFTAPLTSPTNKRCSEPNCWGIRRAR